MLQCNLVTVLLHSAEMLCYSVIECVTVLCRDLLCSSVNEWLCYSVTVTVLMHSA